MAIYYALLASSTRVFDEFMTSVYQRLGNNATWYLDNCLGESLVVSEEEGEDEGDVGAEHHLLGQAASHQKCDLGEEGREGCFLLIHQG